MSDVQQVMTVLAESVFEVVKISSWFVWYHSENGRTV